MTVEPAMSLLNKHIDNFTPSNVDQNYLLIVGNPTLQSKMRTLRKLSSIRKIMFILRFCLRVVEFMRMQRSHIMG